MSESPQKFGKYLILGELGKGGFATVYRARDITLDREVALKILYPQLLTDNAFVLGFRQEARTLAALRHPQIITIYEMSEAEERLYIAMELAHGPSLNQLLAERGRLPWGETLALLKPVSEALDYAHARQIVHRDLKPSNILIDAQRGPLLSDFGFARLIGQSSLTLSRSGGIVGTPGYIAPEVWDQNTAEAPADVYALGCIVFEMLTGVPLFEGPSPMQVMRAHDRGPQFPDAWPETVPHGISGVLGRALARDPAGRYQSAGALWHALNDLDTAVRAAREAAELAAQTAAAVAPWRAETEAALSERRWSAARMALGRWLALAPHDPAALEARDRLEQLAAAAATPPSPPPVMVERKVGEPIREAPPQAPPPTTGGVPPVAQQTPAPTPRRWELWAVIGAGLLALVIGAFSLSGLFIGPPQIVAFSVTPKEVQPGGFVTVVWDVQGAKVVRIEPLGEVPASGKREHRPEATTEYVLVATDSRGQSAKQSEQVIIVSPPTPPEPGAPQILTFSVTPREARPGDLVTVVWEVKGAEVVRIEPFGEVPAIGRREHRPEATTDYRLVATNPRGQSATRVERVNIIPPPTSPSVPAPAGLIAFNSYRGNDTDRRGSRIFTIRPDGSALMQPGYDFNRDFDPVWSPDGRRILFSSYRHTPPDAIDYESFSEIYVMNVDGSDLRRLTDNGVPDWALGWSPDGNKIVFYSKPDWPNDTSYCFEMNADGGGVARLPTGPGNCTDPAWSPAGDRIAFYSNRDGEDEIYVVNLDGSGLAQLTNNRARDFRPRWSRDGRRLVFVSERDGNAEVYTMNADGSDQQNRSNHSARDWFADWAPDGRFIVFTSNRDGNDEIYRMNTDGAEQINLTNVPDVDDQFPSWSWQ